MLGTLIVIVREPPDSIEDDDLRDKLNFMFYFSIVSHVICALVAFVRQWIVYSKQLNVLEVVTAYLSVYLMLYCLEIFSELSKLNVSTSSLIDPNSTEIDKGKPPIF